MIRKLTISVLALGLCSVAPSASAAVIYYCSSGPGIDLVANGCVSGEAPGYPGGGDGIFENSGGGDDLAAVNAAIFAATGVAPVNLSLYGKSDKNPSLFTFTGVSPAGTSGTWDVINNGVNIKYVTVKAANSFALYELAGMGANSGIFSTSGLLNKGGNQPEVSHISFWQSDVTAAVPEPATWAMMLFGFGAVGGAMRSRRRTKMNYRLA